MSICGIYALSFNNGDHVYIGQSQNIHVRISRHMREMQQQKHYNYRVQNAYNKYGLPEAVVIEKCTPNAELLNAKENFWIDEFDSCLNGLNIRDKDESALRGTNSNAARYSKEQILQVFELLLDANNSSKYIESITGVPSGNINCIARSASHLWLKDEYPEKYVILESLKGTRQGLQHTLASKGKKWPIIVAPTGEQYSDIGNLKRFCETHSIPYDQMYRTCTGKRNSKSTHGWYILKPIEPVIN